MNRTEILHALMHKFETPVPETDTAFLEEWFTSIVDPDCQVVGFIIHPYWNVKDELTVTFIPVVEDSSLITSEPCVATIGIFKYNSSTLKNGIYGELPLCRVISTGAFIKEYNGIKVHIPRSQHQYLSRGIKLPGSGENDIFELYINANPFLLEYSPSATSEERTIATIFNILETIVSE